MTSVLLSMDKSRFTTFNVIDCKVTCFRFTIIVFVFKKCYKIINILKTKSESFKDMSSQSGNLTNSGFENKQQDDNEWKRILSMKENILYGIPPYMPILIENIPNYVQLDDFEFDRVKEVQTVGIVYGSEWEKAIIYNCCEDNPISIQLTFTCCKREALQKYGYKPGAKIPCKLFGRLINYEEKPLLEIHHFLKTNDLEGCLKTTTMLSQLVRQKYHYYTCSKNP